MDMEINILIKCYPFCWATVGEVVVGQKSGEDVIRWMCSQFNTTCNFAVIETQEDDCDSVDWKFKLLNKRYIDSASSKYKQPLQLHGWEKSLGSAISSVFDMFRSTYPPVGGVTNNQQPLLSPLLRPLLLLPLLNGCVLIPYSANYTFP